MSARSLLCLCALFLACGGSSPSPSSPDKEAKSSEAADEAPKASKRSSGPPRVSCDDGSCFSCGEATCLTGYYCRVTPTAHGCGWSRACATKPTCACLSAALRDDPGCSCEEREGGIYVLCDGAKL